MTILVAAPIGLELAVALWRRQVAPKPVRKLVWLMGVQVILPIVFAAATGLVLWLDNADPDALWSFGMTFGLIAIGAYAFSWFVTTVIGFILIHETQPPSECDSQPCGFPIAGEVTIGRKR